MNNNTAVSNSIPEHLLDDIKDAILSKDYGSVEIYIESGRIVQITERTIKKTERINNEHNPSIRVFSNKR